MNSKLIVTTALPDAHCVKLNDGSGYIVWPRRGPGPRGGEACAIGYGKTATQAWEEAEKSLQAKGGAQ